jgi:hypothetical protein
MLRRDLDSAMTCFISAKKEERERASQAKAHAAALAAALRVLKALLRLYQDSVKALLRLYVSQSSCRSPRSSRTGS